MTKSMRARFPSFALHFWIICLLVYLILVSAPRQIVAQSMSTPRRAATATELNDGRVLIAGGQDQAYLAQSSADLYTPATGGAPAAFLPTGPMTTARSYHTASLLRDGRVLLAGGVNADPVSVASAEIYDPATGKFTATGSMATARFAHAAAVLPDGRVLVAGGANEPSAEIYDPATGEFHDTGSMTTARYYPAMVVLNNGNVLVAGGHLNNTPLASAEIYDPASGTFSSTGSMNVGKAYITLTLLDGGRVFAAEAESDSSDLHPQIYDPGTGWFTNIKNPLYFSPTHIAALLTNGQVLVAGVHFGLNTMLYDPVTDTFNLGPLLSRFRYWATATLLTDSSVLLAGGDSSTAEIYSPGVFEAPGLSSIAVDLVGSANMGSAVTLSYRATGTFSNGAKQILQGVVWNTADPKVAVISNDVTNRGVALPIVTSGSTMVQACAGKVCGYATTPATPQLTNPTPGTALSGSTAIFEWIAGMGATSPTSYRLLLGTTGAGASDVYNGSATTAMSATVSNLPLDGVTLYARLYYKLNGTWQSLDYTYTESVTLIPPALTSPVPGSTLSSTSATFTWSPAAGSTIYRLLLGTTGAGASDVYNGSPTASTSAAVSTIPANGARLYARLMYMVHQAWYAIDYTFTQPTSIPPTLTSPVPGSTLSGPTATFTWTPGVGYKYYRLTVSTGWPGQANVYNEGTNPGTSAFVSGIPMEGVTFYVRLYYTLNGTWLYADYTYTEGTPVPPVLTSPAPGITLSGSIATFTWSPPVGPSPAACLFVGTTWPGAADVYDGSWSTHRETSEEVSGIPTNGAKLYVRLAYRYSWNDPYSFIDFIFTEAGTISLPALTSPVPGITLSGSSATFTWTPGSGPSAYALTVGTAWPGSTDVYRGTPITATSVVVPAIPTNGAKLYVRLMYRLNASWSFIDYIYTQAGTVSPPAIISPAPGGALPGSSATFTWTPGAGPSGYALQVGTTWPGASDVYRGSITTGTSAAVSAIPTNAAKLYVRLMYRLNGVWNSIDYIYTEAGH
jgi:hypothetical protein